MKLWDIYETVIRRKSLSAKDGSENALSKQLTTFDLIALGTCSSIGLGTYVLVGSVARNLAGPAVIISVILASMAAFVSGLCYAEFGIRIPQAGQVYTYAYVTVGELIAFAIGWDAILAYSIGAAGIAGGLSNYIDAAFNGTISAFCKENLPLNAGLYFAEYFDILSFLVIILITFGLSFGVRLTAFFGIVFTVINILVIIFVISLGSYYADVENWKIRPENLPKDEIDYGEGGFLPYGMTGVLRGVSVCFYAFIGFDIISSAGEEAENPTKSIPRAIIFSLVINLVSLISLCTVLTLMVPYYDQFEDAPLTTAFRKRSENAAEYVITVGAVLALCGSLLGCLYAIPRIIYAMANDGLLFKFLSKVSKRYQTPFYATMTAGILTAIIKGLFNVTQLIQILSIGFLLAYTAVAICVLLLRYEYEETLHASDPYVSFRSSMAYAFVHDIPSRKTQERVALLTLFFCLGCIGSGVILFRFPETLRNWESLPIIFLTIFLIMCLVTLISIASQPQCKTELEFKVPLVPWLPAFSIYFNVCLMIQFDTPTWVRLFVWSFIGLVIYLAYSIWHSKERRRISTTSN